LKEAYTKSHAEVVAHAVKYKWNVSMSGATAVSTVWKGDQLWTANAGDSRLVCGSRRDGFFFQTEDHKPELAEEKERIDKSGGEVRSETYPDGWVDTRIYAKGQKYPGLCMARTLGDEAGKIIGVIAEPTVKLHEVDLSQSPWIALASDGIWEFISSEFVVKAINKAIFHKKQSAKTVCQKLADEARKRWKKNEGDYVDDITIVFLPLA